MNSGITMDTIRSIQVTDETRGMFKGTLAIIIVYGVLVGAIMILASTKFGSILSNEFYAFTVTFVLGVFAIILLLLGFLISQTVPKKPDTARPFYEAQYQCPDMYKLVLESTSSNLFTPDALSKYDTALKAKCVPIYNNMLSSDGKSLAASNIEIQGTLQINSNIFVGTNNYGKYGQHVYNMLSSSNIFATDGARCNEIYPGVLKAAEPVPNPELGEASPVGNEIRCHYASLCGTNWSSLDCTI